MLVPQLGHSLTDEEAAPSLQSLLREKHLGHLRRDLRLGLAAVHDPGVDVVAVPFLHLLVRVEHCRDAHEEGFRNLGVAFTPCPTVPDLLRLQVGYQPI